jgi:hypothetical protein
MGIQGKLYWKTTAEIEQLLAGFGVAGSNLPEE